MSFQFWLGVSAGVLICMGCIALLAYSDSRRR